MMNKDTFIATAVATAQALDASAQTPWLSDYRQQQCGILSKQIFPHRKVEFFKYCRFDNIADIGFSGCVDKQPQQMAITANANQINLPAPLDLSDTNTETDTTSVPANLLRLVFMDGVFKGVVDGRANGANGCDHDILDSSIVCDDYNSIIDNMTANAKINITLTSFADANSTQQQRIIQMLEAQELTHNIFSLLNAASTDNGILLEITSKDIHDAQNETDAENETNTETDDIEIEILYLNSPHTAVSTTKPQVLVTVASKTKVTLLERVLNVDSEQATKLPAKLPASKLSTTRTLFYLAEASELTHYHLQLENAPGMQFGNVQYDLAAEAKLHAFHIATGSQLKKMDVVAKLLGEHAHAGINGLYLATQQQQVDYHTCIDHLVANCTTDENFCGVVNGQGEAVFNGRIHIYPDAQKTLAEMSNKNLLLSDGAAVHTKPELEIYADNVICAHGATVSQLDDASVYYLQARGIDKAEAERMLGHSFVNELLLNLPPALANYLRPLITVFLQ